MDKHPDSGTGTYWRRRGATPLLGLGIGLVALIAYWPGIFGYLCGLKSYTALKPLYTIDLRLGDMLHRRFARFRPTARPPRLCIVGMTDEDLSNDPAAAHRRHALMVRRLSEMGAAVIALDFDFSGERPGDEELAAAMRESGRVVISRRGVASDGVSTMDPGEAAAVGPTLSPALRSDGPVRWRDGAYRLPLRSVNPVIDRAAAGAGHVTLFYDADLVARRVPAAVGDTRDAREFAPLAVAALMAFEHRPTSEFRIEADRLDFGDEKVTIPLAGCGSILVNFQQVKRLVDMRPYELRRLDAGLGATDSPAPPVQFYRYADVLEGELPHDAFSGAIVFVSACGALDREEMRVTPVGNQYEVTVQAMLLHSILSRQFLTPVKPLTTALAMLALAALIGTVCFGFRVRARGVTVILGGLLLLAAGVAAILLVAGLMRRGGSVLETTPFLLAFGLTVAGGVAASAIRMSDEAERRGREMELLLVAGRRHLTEFSLRDAPQETAIPGSNQIALSASLTQRTPDVVAESFWQTLPCEGCVLFVVGEQNALSFTRAVFHGFSGGISRENAEALTVRFAWEALKEGHTTVRSRRGSAWLPPYAPETLRNMMTVPVVARGQPMAVAVLLNKLATPSSPQKEFTEDDLRLAAALRYQAAALLENARRYQHEYAMFDGFARALAKAVDFRDRYTRGHSERVAHLSVGIAGELGLNKDEIEIVQRAAILHDLGKIGVSDIVLRKPGRLTAEEFALIRTHAAKGYDILSATPSFEALLPGIRHHHERYDGMGYPDGLAGKDIPLLARIIAAADAFDAMTSDRPYRRALPMARARKELIAGAGTQFEPVVVQALLKYLAKRKLAREAGAVPPALEVEADLGESSADIIPIEGPLFVNATK
jgi:HD-GYP domain-containing protein (c-di-GMP phosphodiesterase class II)/CHASE2 domain-containing sensor protein